MFTTYQAFYHMQIVFLSSLVVQSIKSLPAMQEPRVQSLGQEDPLEKEMATHSSILAWRIPWTKEPGRLQSMGSQEWTRLSDYTTTTRHSACTETHQCSLGLSLQTPANTMSGALITIVTVSRKDPLAAFLSC